MHLAERRGRRTDWQQQGDSLHNARLQAPQISLHQTYYTDNSLQSNTSYSMGYVYWADSPTSQYYASSLSLRPTRCTPSLSLTHKMSHSRCRICCPTPLPALVPT